MSPDTIDWHRTAILAAVIGIGIVGLVVVWKVTKLLIKLALLLAVIGVVAGVAVWWRSAH